MVIGSTSSCYELVTKATKAVALERGQSVDAVEVKIASSRDEFREAFRLIHRSYVRAGLTRENRSGLRVTEHQLRADTHVFVATLRREVISTVSLVMDSRLGLPMEMAFPEELTRLRNRGVLLAEASCLADRRRDLVRQLPVLTELFRWMVQFARRQSVDRLVMAVHPKHAMFYRRFLACDILAGPREFPTVLNQPAVGLSLDFEKIDRERPRNYDRFFGEALAESLLEPRPMSVEDRRYFASLMQETEV